MSATTTSSGSTTRQSVVKLRARSVVEAHRAAAEAGLAPALIQCEQLPGNWWRVTQHFVDGAEFPRDGDLAVVRGLVSELHRLGFVHGDVRAANVIWDKKRAWLVDFDWAGPPGSVYPLPLNSELDWHPNANIGAPMRYEHDTFRLKSETIWTGQPSSEPPSPSPDAGPPRKKRRLTPPVTAPAALQSATPPRWRRLRRRRLVRSCGGGHGGPAAGDEAGGR